MSHNYEKHTWSVGEVITKALIDRMETGIDNAVDKSGDTITYKLDFVKNSSPQQKGTVLWDETTGYGRMKIQQYAQTPTLDTDGFYKNDDPNRTIADTYSFPKKAVDAFTANNYNIFTSKGAKRGIAWFNNDDTTEGNNGILNYLEIDNDAKGKVLQINSNGQPTWATGNYTLSLTGNTLSLIPGTTGGTSTVTLASGVAYSLTADNDNNKIYLSGSTGNTGFTVTKGTKETLSLNPTTHLIDCKIPTLRAADERYVNVSGDMMIGALKIGRYNDNPPEDTPNIQIQGSAINTYGTSNVLGGWTAIYADRTDVNSNGVALQVYGQSKFEKSLACDGVVKGVFLYEVMKAPQATTNNGHTVIQAATSVPAINILYNALINSTNATATTEKSLASIWTRNIKTDNTTTPPTYTQYGTERQLCFGVSAYRNAWFTSNATVPTEEELLNIYNNDNQTAWTDWSQTGTTYLNYLSVKNYSATNQPAGTNERYDFNFYFPVCKNTDWTAAYSGKWPAKFTPYYEILTSKNYRFIAGSYYLTSAIKLGSSTTTANFTILFQDTNDETFTMPDTKYSAYIMLTDRNASNTTNNITISGPYAIYTTNHSSTQLTVIINGFGNIIELPIGTKIDYFVGYGTPCVSSYKDSE